MNKKKCFFIGHRDAPESIYENVLKNVVILIEKENVTEFIVGNYGNFDRMAARAVTEIKQHYPFIKLLMLLPYHPSVRKVDIPLFFDGSVYPDGQEKVPPKAAIIRANRYAVDNTDFVIAYAHYPASNARDIAEYAEKKSNVLYL